jgi:Tol biopolymer transport system component
MSADRWDALSDWHNEWLAADAAGRHRLRAELAVREPSLVADADLLVTASDRLDGFLETPAFLLAIPELAAEGVPLEPGAMLGPYRITEPLASGGMGTVYRAMDVRLDRPVAVKVLSRASDGEPGQRLFLEARLTAQLDHPNVVRLYDVGVSAGRPYLVTELLQGQTLRARLERGPMTVAETRTIAADLARALVAAHAARLVHGDLKPENVFLTRDGTPKVLDFGIARLKQDAGGPHLVDTMSGVLFGTAGYLAPEQVLGQPVDARTDLFTLGAIVFEMLYGRRAFGGEHAIDSLHAVLHETPIEPRDTQSDVPRSLRAIVTRLLEKSPADRFQSAEDVVAAFGRLERVRAAGERTRSRWIAPAIAAAGVAALAWAVANADVRWLWSEPVRTSWTLPAGMRLISAPAISPDGQRVALAVATSDRSVLMVKDLAATSGEIIAGTEGADQPFWSPDGKALGYFAGRRLMRVDPSGGVPVQLATAPAGAGGAWGTNGAIVFAPSRIETPLLSVAITGGAAAPITTLDRQAGDNSHRWPAFLPDGVHFVFFVRSTSDERRGVYLARVDKPGESRLLFNSDSPAVYVQQSGERGALLTERSGRIEVREFDHRRLSLIGDPHFIDGTVGGATPHQPAMLSASASVMTIVTTRIPFGDRLIEVQRDGRALRTWPDVELQNWPRVSADGRWLLRQRIDALRGNPDIWAEHLERRTRVRVTTAPEDEAMAVWSPVGTEVAYVTGHTGTARLFVAAADGTGAPRELRCPGSVCRPTDWTPDGLFLVVNVQDGSDHDVWLVATSPARTTRALLSQPFVERDARISPDGRWVAYVSEETGRAEVSVRRFDGLARREVISPDGGDQPVWRRDGNELFFVEPNGRLMVVPARTTTDAGPVHGPPAAVPIPPIGFGHFGTQYDVSPDGQRVYYFDRRRDPGPSEVVFVTGWQRQR